MNHHETASYICPATGSPLHLEVTRSNGDEILDGYFVNTRDERFPIIGRIPDFTWPPTLHKKDAQTRDSYESMADAYDSYGPLPFMAYRSDENKEREHMMDLLEISPGSRVLEIGCGTGIGAMHIARRLGSEGRLYLQEIAPKLLEKAVSKLEAKGIHAEFSIANGSYLPFPDGYFDAAHHFGGINTFGDISRCLSELARVVKPGGKVVVGDEGLGPWLRDSEFGRIMTNSNPLLKCEPPMVSLPPLASEVRLEYIMMGAFYLIDFRVAKEAPQPDYHVMIPSERGGSHWTRYHGQLEGVTDEAKRLAHAARKKLGISMHDWLDDVVRKAASDQLNDGGKQER